MLDPILSEIRQIREAFSDKYHGNVTAMLAALRASGEASGRKTVTLTPRRYSPPHARSQGDEIAGSEGFTEGSEFLTRSLMKCGGPA